MGLSQHKRCRNIILRSLLCIGKKLVQLIKPNSHFHALQFITIGQILLGLFRLHTQRLQLQLQLGDLIADTGQVFFRMHQLPLGFFLAVTVLGDTCRLLKDLTAVGTLQRQNFVNTTLTDIGIAFSAQTGIHKHFVDITQTGRLAVDIILAVTAAVVPAGDHHFVCIVRKGSVCIVQSQCGFSKANSRPFLGAAKDHIFHLGATERLTALLAHYPQNGIGNIGFTGTVRSNDGGNVIAKADQGLIREGLKALHF